MSNTYQIPLEERTFIEHARIDSTIRLPELLDRYGGLTPEAKEKPQFKAWSDGALEHPHDSRRVASVDIFTYNNYYWAARDWMKR